jgi:DNA (cytosine-5)-methyltransferase 1
MTRPAGNANELDFCVPVSAYTTKMHNTAANNAGKVFEEYSTCLDANSPPPAVFQPVMTMAHGQGGAEIAIDRAPTLTCNHEAPIAFQQIADCLTAAYGTKWNGNASATNGSLFAAQPTSAAFKYTMGAKAHGIGYADEQSPTLDTKADSNAVLTPAMAVRRLTPVECERLQGFPDEYTAIPWRSSTAANCPDGPRYKALGNSMATPVMRWIGERIQQQESKQ